MSLLYIYPGTHAKTLENALLTETQLELLLSAKTFEEAFRALNETFLAPLVAKRPPEDLPLILEESVSETKKHISFIAPHPDRLSILWLKYDFYNLSALIKGTAQGLSHEALIKKCFTTGIYTPETLVKHFEERTLNRLDYFLSKAVERTRTYTEVSEIDRILNITYLEAASQRAELSGDAFLKEYVSVIIDLFNIQANLRAFTYKTAREAPLPLHVSGGSLPRNATESKEAVLDALKRIGPTGLWNEAIKSYTETGSYALIEKTGDEYLGSFLKEKSRSLFSIAPLFSYFQAKKNNIQIIRTILVGKRTGLSELDIRKTLRKRYV